LGNKTLVLLVTSWGANWEFGDAFENLDENTLEKKETQKRNTKPF
jgi:hypothetical protein